MHNSERTPSNIFTSGLLHVKGMIQVCAKKIIPDLGMCFLFAKTDSSYFSTKFFPMAPGHLPREREIFPCDITRFRGRGIGLDVSL